MGSYGTRRRSKSTGADTNDAQNEVRFIKNDFMSCILLYCLLSKSKCTETTGVMGVSSFVETTSLTS